MEYYHTTKLKSFAVARCTEEGSLNSRADMRARFCCPMVINIQ